MRGAVGSGILLLLLAADARTQTTQGVILGRITDSVTGSSLPNASVTCIRQETGEPATTTSDSHGRYALASLSPGRYTLIVKMAQYQSLQAREVLLPVAGSVEMNFELRPLSDLWEAGRTRSWIAPRSQQALDFYGPDVDTSRIAVFQANPGVTTPLETSRSDVVSSSEIQSLPLAGRDVYTMLLLLPGVTSDTATARGFGFSVNGQRASASNYLLDGVENNNQLLTGPLAAAVPEFIQEYRISTTNYSAEYGRTAGFIANVISRAGGNAWHGDGFLYWKNQALDANGFQENFFGTPRAPLSDWEPGVSTSGPVLPGRLFLFGGVETHRSGSRGDPQLFTLPTASFVDRTDASSFAGKLLRAYAPVARPDTSGDFGPVAIAPPVALYRWDALLRTDYSFDKGFERLFSRFALDRIDEPDTVFSPYPQFSTLFQQRSLSFAAGLSSRLPSRMLNEIRAARTGDSLAFETPQTDLPQLADQQGVLLPGGSQITNFNNAYNYRNRGRDWEAQDNFTKIAGRHSIRVGIGFFQRSTDLSLVFFPAGVLTYPTLDSFLRSQPVQLLAEIDPASPAPGTISPQRSYRYRRTDFFAQDSFHVSRRLTVNYGLRNDYFGSPVNVGTQKDLLIQPAPVPDLAASIAHAAASLPATGDQAVFSNARNSFWAVRAGVAWDIFGNARTLLRGSYGIFYDPLFDNLWETVIQNRYQTATWRITQPVTLPASLASIEAAGMPVSASALVNGLAFQPRLAAPRVQSAFAGVQQLLTRGISLEVDALTSRSRNLITTDVVNRQYSVDTSAANPDGRLNPAFGNLDYRANQGRSDYAAVAASLRIRKSRLDGQISYTWSHSLDNQSDPLAGSFFNFNIVNEVNRAAAPTPSVAAFTTQFAAAADRASSDFDQRQNLVFYATYQIPSPRSIFLRDWSVSVLGAVRAGLPYSVYAFENAGVFPPTAYENQRADLVAPSQAAIDQPYPGGRLLLNSAAFAPPRPNAVGTSGRNAFTGPGLFNLDASLARTFHPRRTPESMRLTLRADFYNLLNHANLNNPDSFYGDPQFGVASYGRRETTGGFLSAPLTETARQVQVMLQIHF